MPPSTLFKFLDKKKELILKPEIEESTKLMFLQKLRETDKETTVQEWCVFIQTISPEIHFKIDKGYAFSVGLLETGLTVSRQLSTMRQFIVAKCPDRG